MFSEVVGRDDIDTPMVGWLTFEIYIYVLLFLNIFMKLKTHEFDVSQCRLYSVKKIEEQSW